MKSRCSKVRGRRVETLAARRAAAQRETLAQRRITGASVCGWLFAARKWEAI